MIFPELYIASYICVCKGVFLIQGGHCCSIWREVSQAGIILIIVHMSYGNTERFKVKLMKKARVSDSEVGTAAVPP